MHDHRRANFKLRFEEYYPMLCHIAFQYIPDKESCEDVVQDTFLALWNKGKDTLPPQEFGAYIVTSVKNNCISYLRKQTFETVSIDDRDISLTVDRMAEEETCLLPTISEVLKQLLEILPPKCALVFEMSKLSGMKYKEIAQELCISEKTVENQMGKAIKLLREYAAAHPQITFCLFVLLLTSIY